MKDGLGQGGPEVLEMPVKVFIHPGPCPVGLGFSFTMQYLRVDILVWNVEGTRLRVEG